jgi:hypothetical protein
MIVAIIGYRTYPDCNNVMDQVDDLELAITTFNEKYPIYCNRQQKGKGEIEKKDDRIDNILVGHSSGAHVAMLFLTRQLEAQLQKEGDIPNHLDLDSFISLSGVFSINDHFMHESGRGVEEISPMKPICGKTKESFMKYSPTERIQNIKFNNHICFNDDVSPNLYLLPRKMLFIHGMNDDTVPFTSTKKLVHALRSKLEMNEANCDEYYLKGVEHGDVIIQLMVGGEIRKIVTEWLRRCSVPN